MGECDKYHFEVTADARLAMATYGIANPVEAFRSVDFDIDGYRDKADRLRALGDAIRATANAMPAQSPPTWTGRAATGWDGCENKLIGVLLRIYDFIVWFVEGLIWFLDLLLEAIRWLASLVDWILGLLSVIGAIEAILQQMKVRPPSWLRVLLRVLKLVEKGPKLIITIIAGIAWLIANYGAYVDRFLDWLRRLLGQHRKDVEGCLGRGPDIEDEPIEPIDMGNK